MRTTIGIDIGGSRIKAGIVTEAGEILDRLNEPSYVADSYEASISQFGEIADKLQRGANAEATGIGLSVAGLMDRECRTVIAAPNCTELPGHKLPADVAAITGLPTVMDNDCNLMAIAEGAYGAAAGCRHYVAITLGTGVGGAVISNDVLIRGINGGGGELGHIPIAVDGPVCGCGAVGCLEAFIGKDGIYRHIYAAYPDLQPYGLAEIDRMAREGNSSAAGVFRYIGEKLAVGLGSAVNIFNPELIVIGGGIAQAGELLFAPLRHELKRRCFSHYYDDVKITAAKLGNWAGVIGAALIAGAVIPVKTGYQR